ncbi:MAG: hypothetical protein H8E72_00945 [Candidatus Marinimicrobia bacterium]|nr:hypothetical protein [Candidatus Neomarinimicrobiota bacterium]
MESLLKLCVLCPLLIFSGCCKSDAHAGHHHPHSEVAKEGNFLCGKCGEIKNSDKCCDPNAQKCGCGLIHGSPGCCKIDKGADVKLCAHCGQVKGTETCCKKDAKTCSKCGLHKGSPGCCKIEKK